MSKLFTFFTSFVKSLIDPTYYADILHAKFSFSIKYFFLLTVILSLVTAVKVAIPLSLFNLDASLTRIVKIYPADLVVKINNSRLSINKPFPYFISMPLEWKSEGAPANIVAFDTDKNVTGVRSFYDYNTIALVTETSVYTVQERSGSGVKAYAIPKDLDNVTLIQPTLLEWKNTFMNVPLIKSKGYIPLISVGLFFLMVPFSFVFRLITAFFYALIVYFIASIFKAKILNNATVSLIKIWQVSLHSLTLPIVLTAVFGFTPFVQIAGPAYFLIYVVFTLYVLHQATKVTSVRSIGRAVPVKTVKKAARK